MIVRLLTTVLFVLLGIWLEFVFESHSWIDYMLFGLPLMIAAYVVGEFLRRRFQARAAIIWFVIAVPGIFFIIIGEAALDFDIAADLMMFGVPLVAAFGVGAALRPRLLGVVAGGTTAALGIVAGYLALFVYSAFKSYDEPVYSDDDPWAMFLVTVLFIYLPMFIIGTGFAYLGAVFATEPPASSRSAP